MWRWFELDQTAAFAEGACDLLSGTPVVCSQVAAPIAALLTLSRAIWALKQGSLDVAQGIRKQVSDSLDKDSGPGYYPNPSDPTRFFQNQEHQENQDLISYA